MMAVFDITVMVCLYLVPYIIAGARKTKHSTAILFFNLLLGWMTFLWVVALIWALADSKKV